MLAQRISRGKVAELLGLSFHQAEQLFQSCRFPYPLKSSVDDPVQNASLPKIFLAPEILEAALERDRRLRVQE